MASKPVLFQKSKYYSLHPYLDKTLVQHTLLPKLKKQGVIGIGSPGVELPTGEYISLAEAKSIVIDYLFNEANLPEKDQKSLKRTISYTDFASLAENILTRDIVKPEAMADRIHPDKMEAESKASVLQSSHSQDAIKAYAEVYRQLQQYATMGDAGKILDRLFPAGIAGQNLQKVAFAQLIASNFARLNGVRSLSEDQELQNAYVAREFSQILESNPSLSGYRNFLGDPKIQNALGQYVSYVTQQARSQDPNIELKFTRLKASYGKALGASLLNESELRAKIYNALPLIKDNERLALADQILRETIRGSRDSRNLEQIISSLSLNTDLEAQTIKSLQSAGIELSLEYRQGEINFWLGTHELTKGELKLLKNGINPFLTTLNPNDDKLVNKEKSILKEYNSKNINHPKITLQEAYAQELQESNPDLDFLNKARSLLNRDHYYASLSKKEQILVESAKTDRWFSDLNTRISKIHDGFFDTIFDLEDTLTGKKWFYKQLDNLELKLGKIYIPGTKIPLFKINLWLFEEFEKWKEARTLALLAKTEKWTSKIGKTIHSVFNDYKLGGYTVEGASFVRINRIWSSLAVKASAGLAKGSAKVSSLLLKVGAKGLAKVTTKLGEMGASALMSASGFLSALGIILLIKDVIEIGLGIIKWGWEKLKKMFGSAEGATAAIITGASLWLAATWGKGLAFVATLFAPMVIAATGSIILVLGISFGALGLFSYLSGEDFNITTRLDSGTSFTQLVGDIVCTLTGSEAPNSSSNPRLSAGKCVAQLLSKFGINPLVRGNATGPGFTAFSTGLGNGAAAAEAQYSATNYGSFQCSGFDSVVDLMTGGGGGGFGDAHNLDTIRPAGYRYVAGVSSCAPGDFFVDKNGTWGHTGLFISLEGANIVCLDANSDGNGLVRDETTCRWPTGAIAGCLKSN